jgi:hypothetical protein
MQHADIPIEHNRLLLAIWGSEDGDGRECLRAYIMRLRRKIEGDPNNPEYLFTLPWCGYIFCHRSRHSEFSISTESKAVPLSGKPTQRNRNDGGVGNIAYLTLRRLRNGIRNDEISFPSQVPVFNNLSRPDIQWRLVQLYFVRGWSCLDLGHRYGVSMERVRQMLSQWVRRAVLLGYLQEMSTADRRPGFHPVITSFNCCEDLARSYPVL